MHALFARLSASTPRGKLVTRGLLTAALAGTTAMALLPSGAAHSAPTPPTPTPPAATAQAVRAQPVSAARDAKLSNQRDVTANLWEWNWTSVAKECTTVLGPKGYGGVQVAPPQDSLSKTDGPVHPWWEGYQPVTYKLTSRMGNEAQFKSMVATCRKAGVK